ncbi:MAG: flagellar biosynthesis protein FlhA [Deltaproteobacteria bacterium]|nr:MAG: flagellar biosynthesis protein FlhA [Deltaproteobacteria bacterium]
MNESRHTASRAVGIGLTTIMLMLVLPIPAPLLDLLLAVSVTASLLVFLLALHFGDPVEFSTFPSVLLIATMLRLSLNIASTRLILLHGHEGPDAAGRVIQAFGRFVVGGSYVVGIIVFLILVVINFKVITAGAGRISEVAARFTLDAMPGKQMAIDNDLANGHITEEEARKRRKQVNDEADFYGAMDGANKFVKGDAVAGLIITAVNIVGGIVIGVAQNGLSMAEAAQTYTILTIGDGLVSQIPALLVSTAAGLIASRTASGEDLGRTLMHQLFERREPLFLAGLGLCALSVVPGMPTLAFLTLGGAALAASRRAARIEATADATSRTDATEDAPKPDPEQEILQSLHVDLLALEVGIDLVPYVDRKRGGELIRRIPAIRRQIAQELGIVIPPIHVRDNLHLPSRRYRILLSGEPVAQGDLAPGRLLAIDPGGTSGTLKGERTKDPAFGMDALWITPADRERAEILGYTVVEPSAVAATHLTEVLKRHAAELLGRTELQDLLDKFAARYPKLVEELIPAVLSLGDVLKVLRNLLREKVSIRDLRTILEALADYGPQTKEPEVLTEMVRQRMQRAICRPFLDDKGILHAFVMDPDLERALQGHGSSGPDPGVLPAVVSALESALAEPTSMPTKPVVLTSPEVRPSVAMLAMRHAPGLAVLSFREVPPEVQIKTLGVVRLPEEVGTRRAA